MTPAAEPAANAVRDYFQLARETFDRAEGQSPAPVSTRLRLAGHDMLLRFANGALVPRLARALAHLGVPPDGFLPRLTIRIWDGRSTGCLLPPPIWRREAYLRHGAIMGYHGASHSALFQSDAGMLSLVDLENGEAIVYAIDADGIPYYETAAPLRASLGPWLASMGFQIIHAAAVGHPDAGALIVGAGGSGKSTTAAACIGGALRFLGDDYCAVSAGPEPRVVALYSTAKLRPEGLHRLPHLRARVSNPGQSPHEKPTMFVCEFSPESILPECPVRVILVPEMTGMPHTEIRPCGRAEALRRLGPSTLAQQPASDGAAFRRLAALAMRTPAHVIALGTRLEEIPAAILRSLERATDATPGSS